MRIDGFLNEVGQRVGSFHHAGSRLFVGLIHHAFEKTPARRRSRGRGRRRCFPSGRRNGRGLVAQFRQLSESIGVPIDVIGMKVVERAES